MLVHGKLYGLITIKGTTSVNLEQLIDKEHL